MPSIAVPPIRLLLLRHRASITDLAFLSAILIGALFAFLEFRVFSTEASASEATKTLELNEILVLSAMFVVALLLFSGRRLFEQKKELARRVAVSLLRLAMQRQPPSSHARPTLRSIGPRPNRDRLRASSKKRWT